MSSSVPTPGNTLQARASEVLTGFKTCATSIERLYAQVGHWVAQLMKSMPALRVQAVLWWFGKPARWTSKA